VRLYAVYIVETNFKVGFVLLIKKQKQNQKKNKNIIKPHNRKMLKEPGVN